MTTQKNLYALLVGINDYLSPDIPNLSGTHKDLEDVHQHFLQAYKGWNKQVKILKDEQATRANIVQAFEQHLGQAQEGDIVLFYYSGHGSWGKTNAAFFKFDPDEREEGLVCYDSRVNGQFDLVDKEMAVLLNYVARNGAEVVLLIDSCHSGSLTRFSEATTRLAEGSQLTRGLEDYLYDASLPAHQHYYQQLYQEHGGQIPELPLSRHLVMSACNERELARETKEGGWFTQSLLQVLRENENLSYFQVYSQVFSAISQKHAKQTPQLEAFGLFNANNVFLTGAKSSAKTTRFRIGKSEKTRSFRIEFGAQAGFPLDIGRPINFNIYSSKEAEEPIGIGQVKSVGLVDSEIKLSLQQASKEEVLWGEILDFAITPMRVCFEGATEDLEFITAALQKRDLQQVLLVANDAVCPFVLAWDDKDACYRLNERQQEKVWNAHSQQYEESSFNRPVFILEIGKEDLKEPYKMDILLDTLEHLCQWKYTTELDNPKSRINKQGIDITFNTYSEADAHKVKALVYEGRGTAVYPLEEANQAPKKDYHKLVMDYTEEEPIGYSISIKNNTRDKYYLGLVLISADYGVFPLQSNIELEPGQELEEAIDRQYGSLSISRKGDIAITNYLKVFLSKKEISTLQGLDLPELSLEEQLQQVQFFNNKNFGARTDLHDWCSKTLALTLKRDVNTIGEKEVTIDNRGIIIHSHKNLKANVRLNSPEGNTRSANQLFDTVPNKVENFELFFMDDGSGFPSETVLELTNIEQEEELADNPLEISVPKIEGELVFPFTVETILIPQEDGSYKEETLVLPIGVNTGEDGAGNDLYAIHELPTHSNAGTKSLGKALKMCFGKLFLSQDNYNLCWVDYEQGASRETEGVAEKVKEANTILIVLHGIIGDTGAMAANMEFVTQYYDLVLTYDYENLNTPIPDIATHFKEELTKVGIVEGSGKTVDIVAHSMGGLVSRTFIESPNLKGHQIIRNLYMLGTPNAGSAFSKIATYRDFAIAGLTFAMNLKTLGAASLAGVVSGLSASKGLTITLSQMGVGSDFLSQLNTNATPEGVQYYVIAGDITNYKTEAQGVMAKLMDWAAVKVGGVAYGKEQNDIAVSTPSILGVPQYFNPITKQVDCHHMIYFVHEPSMKILEAWMKDNHQN